MAIEITDEMRAAVLAAECERLGHNYSVHTAFTSDPAADPGRPRMLLASGADPDQAPHLTCTRCNRVWLVIEDGATDYPAAEQTLMEKLPVGDTLRERLRERRERRRNRPLRPRRPERSL